MIYRLFLITITTSLRLNYLPIQTHNPPLRKLHQYFFDHNLQSRVIIPAVLQEVKTRIVARIRRSI
ncbi:hypothetical protein A6V25_31875 [Nostoc sp. ATCC 53789]|nr:hypothetical protein A6V25_31875 [Nostoc sp. ATCC 53789]